MSTINATASLLAGSSSGSNPVQSANEAGSADRFLKLLVTQLQNQDPLNPLDNAQITSQMAQINTVSGIEKLNTTVEGLNGQFMQMQVLQGTALVGRDVTLPGSKLLLEGGDAVGGFELASAADRVTVEVLAPSGRVVDTLNLGAQSTGRSSFNWTPAAAAGAVEGETYSFRITATTGTTRVGAEPLMLDRVRAVSLDGDRLMLETLNSGRVAYGDIRAFN
jgi:flagellar basal-body rod modification protein FlgD